MNTKDLLTNLSFCFILILCCLVSYDKFFAPKFPRIYIVDMQIIEDSLRKEILSIALNNKGFIPSEEYVLERSKEIYTIVENIADDNNALIFYKNALANNNIHAKDISKDVLTIYENLKRDKNEFK